MIDDFDERPLRQEDYQVMAEELRRKNLENELLKKKLAKAPFPWRKTGSWGGMILAGIFAATTGTVFISSVVKGCAEEARKDEEYNRLHPKFKQTYPCYYVRQNEENDNAEPWEKWHVFKTTCDWGCNGRIDLTKDSSKFTEPTFDTKQEAWDWATKTWHMEMCK